jgi:hypothetical protein
LQDEKAAESNDLKFCSTLRWLCAVDEGYGNLASSKSTQSDRARLIVIKTGGNIRFVFGVIDNEITRFGDDTRALGHLAGLRVDD